MASECENRTDIGSRVCDDEHVYDGRCIDWVVNSAHWSRQVVVRMGLDDAHGLP